MSLITRSDKEEQKGYWKKQNLTGRRKKEIIPF